METEFVDWLLKRLPADPRLEVPAGDDAAVARMLERLMAMINGLGSRVEVVVKVRRSSVGQQATVA